MKKHMRIITFVLLLCLLACFFAGCVNNKISKDSSTSAEDTSKNVTTASVEEKQHKLTLLGQDRNNDDYRFSDREKYPVWEEFKKLLDAQNINLEYELVTKEQYDLVLQTRVAAASDLPDIVNITPLDDATSVNLGKQGVLINILDAIKKYSNGNIEALWQKYYPSAKATITADDGCAYWFPSCSIASLDGVLKRGTGWTLQVRRDWLDKYSIDVPKNLDELYDVLLQLRKNDANGNGVEDEFAILNMNSFSNGIAQSFGLANTVITVDNMTDKVITPWYQDNISEYFLFMKRMVDGGLLDQSLIGASGDVINQKISENKVSLIYDYILQTYRDPLVTQEKALYQPIFPITAMEGVTPVFVREASELVWQKFAITSNCKDLEGAIKLFDIIYTKEFADLTYWGVEGFSYEVVDGKKVNKLLGLTSKEIVEKKAITGGNLWGNILLPRVQVAEQHVKTFLDAEVSEYKINKEVEIQSYKNDFFSVPKYALPTEEESNIINKYQTAVNTFSEELHTKLILGDVNLSDLKAKIDEMKAIGLDELIKVYQTRHDRFVAAQK